MEINQDVAGTRDKVFFLTQGYSVRWLAAVDLLAPDNTVEPFERES
jgi:hypothetical protein